MLTEANGVSNRLFHLVCPPDVHLLSSFQFSANYLSDSLPETQQLDILSAGSDRSVITVYGGFFGILGKKQRPFFTEGLWEQTEALTCKQLMTADQHGLRFKHLMKTVITYFNISVSHSSAQFEVSASCSDKQMTSPMTRWILGNGGLEHVHPVDLVVLLWLETWMKLGVPGLRASAEPAAGQWITENSEDCSAVRASCRLQLL